MKAVKGRTKQQMAVSSTFSLLTQISKWGKIHPFLVEQGYAPDSENEDVKSKRCLNDTGTMIMCMLIYAQNTLGNEAYTVGSLADALNGGSYNARKAGEGKIKRVLESISSYQIVDFYRDQHRGKRECIRIEATDLLVSFMEDHFFELKEVIEHE